MLYDDSTCHAGAQLSNQKSLEAAVATAAEFLNSKGKCAIVGGVKVRSCNAEDALLRFADATQYPVTGTLWSYPIFYPRPYSLKRNPTTEHATLQASAQTCND